MPATVRIGVDIGGTFTDVVALQADGRVAVVKVASSPDDYGAAVLTGVAQALQELDADAAAVSELVHGFTVATNALLEGKGEPLALITTAGFRDVLEVARLRTPRLYDLYYQKPKPLVERRLRLEVRERVTADGAVREPLDERTVALAVAAVAAAGVGAVAVSLLHSYANPEHERRVAAALQHALPQVDVSLSSELLPEMREYERTSTTVINAYVRPVVERYLTRLDAELRGAGLRAPLTVMQSNGGLMPVALAGRRPMYCIESGPAAGVVGALELGEQLGQHDLITFDMGGTTAKASLIEDGRLLLAPEYEVGGGMNAGHRLLRGSGYILRVPTIDIAEVSSGGGSIAWVDAAGGMQVGPESAGAVPGPACYATGGERPTVTDANVVLGYLNPRHLLAGTFPIDADRARAAIADAVGAAAGLDAVDAAWGVHMLANVKMGAALRAVSTERGRDPRRFTMIAFGGGGPVHAAGLATALGIGQVVIPPSPGVFSAFGLLHAGVEHHFVQSHSAPLGELDVGAANAILDRLSGECEGLLEREGFDTGRRQLELQVDARYAGQTSELTVAFTATRFDAESVAVLREAFMREHERTYGYRVDEPIRMAGIRVIGRGLRERSRTASQPAPPGGQHAEGAEATPVRPVYFGRDHGWHDTPVIGRGDVATRASSPKAGNGGATGAAAGGPLIIEEYDSTTVVPPGWQVSAGPHGALVLERP